MALSADGVARPTSMIDAPTIVTHGPGPTSNSAICGAFATATAVTPGKSTVALVTVCLGQRRDGWCSQWAITVTTSASGTSGHSRSAHPVALLGENPSRSTRPNTS